jgi:uncharacterized protein (DUF433 family)
MSILENRTKEESFMESLTDRITKTLGVCGGNTCIRGTRITVWGLVSWRKLGLGNAEIMKKVQGLTQTDIEAAWQYAAAHADEIEEAIRQNEEA